MATARLKTKYVDEIRPALIERFGYSTPMQAPKIEKVTVNMGVGEAKQDSKMLEAATEQLATIAGQRPNIRRARKSIAQFKVREGMPVGVAVTLRGERAYEFLDRLMSVAIPRIRDFRGLNPRAFDGRGNYSMGVREQIIFPEIDYDEVDQVRGLDITITTNASSDEEAFALLEAIGMPFSKDGRATAALERELELERLGVGLVADELGEVADEVLDAAARRVEQRAVDGVAAGLDERLVDQGVAGLEVVGDEAVRRAGLLGDAAVGEAAQAVLGDDADGGVEQRLATLAVAGAPALVRVLGGPRHELRNGGAPRPSRNLDDCQVCW